HDNIINALLHQKSDTAPNLTWLKQAKNEVNDKYDKKVWIHVKVNTCKNRYGTDDVSEINKMISEIDNFSRFVYEGIFSHFTSSDEDKTITEQEFTTFKNLYNQY